LSPSTQGQIGILAQRQLEFPKALQELEPGLVDPADPGLLAGRPGSDHLAEEAHVRPEMQVGIG
jgi:hypothetical protein